VASSVSKRPLLISKAWPQAVILVFLFGFFIMGILCYRSYTAGPPIPGSVVSPTGEMLFTGADIQEGQKIFLRNGLMEYGSIFGHGAYLGPDYTADYLRRSANIVEESYRGLGDSVAKSKTADDFKTNQFDPSRNELQLTAGQATAFHQLVSYYGNYFSSLTADKGLRPGAIVDPTELKQLTAFFNWSAWVSSTKRPGQEYSYTNNWPPEPRVGNEPTGPMIVWSVLSLITLLGGIGLLLAAFGRWNFLGWHGQHERVVSFRAPDTVPLTPAQRVCAWFYFVMALLFFIQAMLGGATQHYRADIANFFGINLAQLLPYNLARTWHLQLSIFWVSVSFLAAGIFIVPLISRHEPKGQQWLAYGLLGALAVVVAGSMFGEWAGIFGRIANSWFGDQGFEYLDLGRFWQLLLSIGLLFWVFMLYRTLRGHLRNDHWGNMPWLFFFAALALPAFYAVGLLARQESSFVTGDFWRFWVVHLWVEDFLELFTTIMVAYIFVLLGVVGEKVALRVVYLDILLYSVGGVVGTMHHLYFSGTPVEHMALGAFFSAAEVIPLTFLTLEAWSFLRIGLQQQEKTAAPFPHRWAIMFLIAVGFWNFVGAGIFGFLINLPIVSYYEIGTALTANHAHAAMMGVYGMLAVGLALFGLRYLIPEKYWSERAAKISFWSLNAGLAWMVFATLFPLGILQLYESVSHGYFEARQLQFLTSHSMHLIEWLRLPGDVVFIVGGTLSLLYLTWQGICRRQPLNAAHEGEEILFTDVTPEQRGKTDR
jgi:nitric oxide reductase subunit B